ncbi:MAG TPA: hypothetical protein VJV75_07145 [Candidatus Polarisedimenticolia bacterium]|nr:hypothetical protein [Candidatus Polarisedimenticolia bacterium]
MEPLAASWYMTVTIAALDGIFVGAVGGAIARIAKGWRLWVLLVVAVIYCGIVFRADYAPKTGAVFGLPLLVLAFLISWIATTLLETRMGLRWFWSVPLAIVGALVVAFAWLFLFRVGMLVPTTAAAVADLLLIAFLLLRARRSSMGPA